MKQTLVDDVPCSRAPWLHLACRPGVRFDRGDAIVLRFCGSKKSLATGVPMAGVLFPAAQVGVAIRPLMLFHQLQLIACAIIARRLGEVADTGIGMGHLRVALRSPTSK